MDYLPLFYDVRNRPCLLVGGGEVALRKAQSLIRSQAIVHVIAPEIDSALEQLVREKGGKVEYRFFEPEDIGDYRLVVAATDDEAVNKSVSSAAHAKGCLINVVDNPELSNFITPAVIDRDPLIVAISSGGQAPVLARQLRARIESLVPASYGQLAQLGGRFRERVKQVFSSPQLRRRFWENALQGVPAELALAGNIEAAERLLQEQLDSGESVSTQGEVYLVGAGPGDPDLLTFRALRLMQQADVVLYDRLVSQGVLDLARKDAERIYVGKRRSDHALQQTAINQLLVDLAKQGKRVLRLKGGDPFIFGRGGEEIEQLAEEGIPFQVVPGITAASGCASYAGIPLTHRDHAQSVRFITGHLKNGQSNVHFPELLDPAQTLVFYMGLVGLPDICQRLIDHGRDPHTPAALIEKGTTREQRVFVATISDLAEKIAGQDVHGPTLLIIGDVVSLHSKLHWFHPRPVG
ncbi:uroporphyrinogen-III C-methyltransferase [Proteobacteria bacterium 005FR1]|nr:uroporphyrinogen-III C-methyltransferase [Proteobacteria bacterium 005FR1]